MALQTLLTTKMNLSISKVPARYFIALCLFIVLSLPVLSQPLNPASQKLAEQLHLLAKNSPPEMAYIQTSKCIYQTLEDLWFKVYLLDSHSFAPSALSQTLYLQMFNENTGQVVWQEEYEVQNGFAAGHIFLQDSLAQGDYLLAAYTPNSFFGDSTELKAIRRVHIREEINETNNGWKEPLNLPAQPKKGTIQFTAFPEGGNLVSGIESKLAFKAVNTDGTPQEIQGILFEDTVSLVKFKSAHAGMGSLNITPLAGKKYHIRLLEPATDSTFVLPQVYPEGMTIRLAARDNEFLEFRVSQSPAFQKRAVYLSGQVRGVVYCIATGIINKELKIKISLKEFPCQGIAEFTLFNDSLISVAERLVFINPGKNLQIETQLDKEKYATREKATLKITVKDENGQPVKANLGVRVYDKLFHNPSDPENILTHCYLTSQLRGRIYNPAWYFDLNNEGREEALDLLLLTQGWRRYVWGEPALKESGNAKQQVIFDGVEGEVHATAKLKKAWALQQYVMAFYPGKNKNKDFLMAGSTGKFTVSTQHLKTGQGNYVYLRPMTLDEYKPRISLSDPFQIINEIKKAKEINYPLPGPVVIKEKDPTEPYVEGHKMIKLAEVEITAHGTKTFRSKYIGQLDSMAKLEFCTDFICHAPHHILNCFECKNDPRDLKPVEGKIYMVLLGPHGEILDADWPGPVFYGQKMITYHNPYLKFTEEELMKMNNLSRVKAYYPHREFYQPNYDKEISLDSIADFRNTLVWAPLVITNDKGEASVEFFCSDINTGFIGNIEGVGSEGLLGAKGFEFGVLKTKSSKRGK